MLHKNNKMQFIKNIRTSLIFLICFLIFVSSGIPAEQEYKLAPAIEKGQRVFICGHSFHVYIEKLLEEATKVAGIDGHVTVGTQFIGGSTVSQHWEQSKAKNALMAGNVDILTLSPHLLMPDPAIDKFADLAIKYNPDIRIFIQLSWFPWDGLTADKFQKSQYDAKTVDDLIKQKETDINAEYYNKFKTQINAINKKYDKSFVYLVPAAFALNTLRQQVAAGKMPGITKQADLFNDPMGHPSTAVKWLVTYCYFAAIYHKSPVGLIPNDKINNDVLRQQNRILQQIAWEAVCAEPLSGVTIADKPVQK